MGLKENPVDGIDVSESHAVVVALLPATMVAFLAAISSIRVVPSMIGCPLLFLLVSVKVWFRLVGCLCRCA